jgi:hypothetical protein
MTQYLLAEGHQVNRKRVRRLMRLMGLIAISQKPSKGTKEEIKELNSYFDSLQAKVYEAHLSLLDKNEPVTVWNSRAKLLGTKKHTRMILEVFQHHNDQVNY